MFIRPLNCIKYYSNYYEYLYLAITNFCYHKFNSFISTSKYHEPQVRTQQIIFMPQQILIRYVCRYSVHYNLYISHHRVFVYNGTH